MNLLRRRLSFLLLIALTLTACSSGGTGASGGGGGGEGGDPSVLIGKSVAITPVGGGDSFNNVFIDADTVSVSKSSGASALTVNAAKDVTVDTVTVSYTVSASTISYSALFSDGTNIDVVLTLGTDGNVSSGSIQVNGVAVASSFVVSSPTNPGTAADALTAGFAAFQSHDLTAARDAYCNELADSPANSSLAFGCFWAKLMLLPTTGETGAILTALDEPLFDTTVNYYGASGVFTLVSNVHVSSQHLFNYRDFNLPFVGFLDDISFLGGRDHMVGLVERAVSNGVSTEEFQTMLQGLVPHFAEFEGLLSIVLADSSFSFTLPKELFNVTHDVNVTPIDAQLFMAGTESTIFSLEIIDSYDLGVDSFKVVQGGVYDPDIMLEDLNGTGATVHGVTVDTIAVGTLSNAAKIAAAKTRFLLATSLSKSALETLHAGTHSDFFTPWLEAPAPFLPVNVPEVVSMLSDLNNSAQTGSVTLATQLPDHTVTLNLKEFFLSPPNAATTPTSAGDPFVNSFGENQAVEGYFRSYLDGIATF